MRYTIEEKKEVVKETIINFMNYRKAFTSVDVSNALRAKDIFIKHSEVSKFLRDNWISLDKCANYTNGYIRLPNNKTTFLYRPYGTLADSYTNTNQTLIKDDVNSVSNIGCKNTYNSSWQNCYKQKRDSKGRFVKGKIN